MVFGIVAAAAAIVVSSGAASSRRIGAHGILADDMGLGKTLQALMAVAMCHHHHPGEQVALNGKEAHSKMACLAERSGFRWIRDFGLASS